MEGLNVVEGSRPAPVASAGAAQALEGSALAEALAPTAFPSMGSGHLADPDEALVGRSLGSFRIVRKLGEGGMGTVYLAEQEVIGSKVAVKFLHPQLAEDPVLVARFQAEARAVNLIAHENVVNIFDQGMLAGRPYLIMEYLEGRSLSSLRGPVPLEVLARVLSQVCDALAAAHRQEIVHRDLKPENILLVQRGGQEHFVKLLDFGVARLGKRLPGSTTAAGSLLGTPEYMSPAQSSGLKVDGRSDLYSLGVIAYQLATGRLPFQGTGLQVLAAHREEAPPLPRALNPDLPEAVEEVILCALAKRPEDRFRSAAEFKAALLLSVDDPTLSGVTPLPSGPREVELQVSFADEAGRALGTLRCTQLSRGGLFACTEEALPPLFARLSLKMSLEGRERTCRAEVVRHVRTAEALSWGMPAGFGVQFVDLPAEVRDAITRVSRGLPPPGQGTTRGTPDDRLAAQVLAEFLSRDVADPYEVLLAQKDSDGATLRQRGRMERQKLEALQNRRLSATQRERLSQALERVSQAEAMLSNRSKRAWHDAGIGNFYGVARCIGGGLQISELEEMRQRFLAERPGAEAKAAMFMLAARSYAAQGCVAEALREYERALVIDPFHLELQRSYWGLRRQQAARTGQPAQTPVRGTRLFP